VPPCQAPSKPTPQIAHGHYRPKALSHGDSIYWQFDEGSLEALFEEPFLIGSFSGSISGCSSGSDAYWNIKSDYESCVSYLITCKDMFYFQYDSSDTPLVTYDAAS
jgi:hypothetical protein